MQVARPAAAKEAGHEVRVGRFPFAGISATTGGWSDRIRRETGELLGAHMAGPEG